MSVIKSPMMHCNTASYEACIRAQATLFLTHSQGVNPTSEWCGGNLKVFERLNRVDFTLRDGEIQGKHGVG